MTTQQSKFSDYLGRTLSPEEMVHVLELLIAFDRRHSQSSGVTTLEQLERAEPLLFDLILRHAETEQDFQGTADIDFGSEVEEEEEPDWVFFEDRPKSEQIESAKEALSKMSESWLQNVFGEDLTDGIMDALNEYIERREKKEEGAHMAKTCAATFVRRMKVVDPETGHTVGVDIYKVEGGPMAGFDSSYLEQAIGPVYSPFDRDVVLALGEDEAENQKAGSNPR